MSDKYSHMDGLAGFGFLINTMGGGGDANQAFPRSDAEDMSRGARFIPGEVTMARRRGERVEFVDACGPCCWYWLMPDGSLIYHWERWAYELIGKANGRELVRGEYSASFDGGAGPCPSCGNPNTNGGTVKAADATHSADGAT